MKTLLRLYRHELPLFWTGVLGLVLGGLCFAAMARYGVIVEPEGNLYKAASFDVAVGLFLLTLALIVGVAGFSPRGLLVFRWTLIPLALFGYSVETIQIFRGFDPRFSRVSSPIDQAIGGLFFLSALAIFVLFLTLTVRFFFRPTTGERGTIVLALRYGTAAAILAFCVGITMSILNGPRVGANGNLLPLHAAGFHGLQAVPLVALLLRSAKAPFERARRAVHASGILWLSACVAIGWQSASGRSVLDLSPATAAALLLLLAWGFILATAFRAFRRSVSGPERRLAA